MSQLQNDLACFAEEHPQATYDDVVSRFGSAEEIASAYLDTLDSAELSASFQKAKRVKRAVIAACVVVVLMAAAVAGIIIHDNLTKRISYYEVQTNYSATNSDTL